MNVYRAMKAIISLFLLLTALPAQAAATARVAVLPFEIYSDESTAPLKDLIAQSLSSHLAAGNRLEVVDQARVRSILGDKASLTFNESVLKVFSEKLEAPFLVLGSMTRIGDNVSLDTYIFNSSSTPVFSKEFCEGKNLDSVTREMAGKVNARILLLAPPLPEKQGEAPPAAPPPPLTPELAPPEKPVREEAVTADAPALQGRQPGEEERQLSPVPPPLPPPQSRPASAAPRGDGETPAPPPAKREKSDREEPRPSPFNSTKPVKITSASLEADNKRNLVTFKGNVVAKQGDMVIFADTMTVDYEKEGGGIKKVEASGNVKMSQENRVATGTRIIFYNPEQKIVMTGNPKIWQGDNLISCEKITVLLEEDKIFFEGKVDSTIFPKSIDEEKQKDTRLIEPIPADSPSPAPPAPASKGGGG